MKCVPMVIASLLLLATPLAAQEVSNSRADIANQRIHAEMEMRRRAEEAAREAEQQAAQRSTTDVAAPDPAPTQVAAASERAPASSARSRADMSRTLQQIRTLGELRDAGYVTEAEFQRIKERILEGEL